MRFIRQETDWHNVGGQEEAFYLRVYGAGEYRYPGADLGILVTRDRMQTDSRRLLDRGVAWARAVAGTYRARHGTSHAAEDKMTQARPVSDLEINAYADGELTGEAAETVRDALLTDESGRLVATDR